MLYQPMGLVLARRFIKHTITHGELNKYMDYLENAEQNMVHLRPRTPRFNNGLRV